MRVLVVGTLNEATGEARCWTVEEAFARAERLEPQPPGKAQTDHHGAQQDADDEAEPKAVD